MQPEGAFEWLNGDSMDTFYVTITDGKRECHSPRYSRHYLEYNVML